MVPLEVFYLAKIDHPNVVKVCLMSASTLHPQLLRQSYNSTLRGSCRILLVYWLAFNYFLVMH